MICLLIIFIFLPSVIPPEPDVIFKEFLESEHGQFLESYIKNNDPLPSYESSIHIKTSVPATSKGDRPSLLLHNLPGNGIIQPITQVSSIQSAMSEAKNHLLVLLGSSGCGKTRSCYELLCCNWGLYFVASRKGNGGSDDIEMIGKYLLKKMTDDCEENRNVAEHIVSCAILSRLFILCKCISSSSTFNAQRLLLLQACQRIFGKSYGYDDDLFRALMLQLADCTRSSMENYIGNIYQKIIRSNVFPIILDEAQALEMTLMGKFRSRYYTDKERSLISPIIQTFKTPTPSFSGHCAIACGTGLGLLSLGETLGSLGIAKPDLDVDKFTNFGRWRDIAHVKEYISSLIEPTDNEYNLIYERFRDRFHPIASIVEEVLMGKTIRDAVDGLWTILTNHKTNEQSLYKQLHDIIDRKRPNHVLLKNVLDLYKSLTLSYYYSGSPYLCTDESQFKIIESGFGCFRSVKPPTISELEQIYKDEVMLQILSVNKDALYPAIPGENILVAYIDEPFALTASYNFFKDNNCLPEKILNTMTTVNNASSWGFLWQMYLPEEFERIFNGQYDIRNMPIFSEIAKNYDLPAFCIGPPKIVKSSNVNVPRVANATTGYTLDKFFNESPELRPAFYFPDDHCGPDIIFFVEFEDKVTVPVFVQVKLRYSVKTIAGTLSTISPEMFYKDKNGKMFQEESNKPIVNKIIQQCEAYGSIGLLVAYPADVCQESFVTNNHPHNLRNRSSQQLIGIIDQENASTVFQGDHLLFLDTLKNTIKVKKVNEKAEETGEGSKSGKKQKT